MVITHLCIPLVGSGNFQERHLVWMVIIVKIPHHSFCPQGPLTSRLVSRARSPVVLSSGPTHQSSCLQGPLTSRLVSRAHSPVVLSSGPTHQSSCLQGLPSFWWICLSYHTARDRNMGGAWGRGYLIVKL